MDRHYRTQEQLISTLSSPAAPAISSGCVEAVLGEMVHSGMIVQQGRGFCPASKGWEFIESMRIFSNIQQIGTDVAVVDVDTGREIGRIGSLTGGVVQIAGQSYSVVSQGVGAVRVRKSLGAGSSPRYGARALPYGTDVGPCVRNLLGGNERNLEIVDDGQRLVLVTWLGRLMNCALAAILDGQGVACTPSAFALAVEGIRVQEVLERTVAAARRLGTSNPLASLDIEKTVDCGPYFDELSSVGQRAAREDWLDSAFVGAWAAGLDAWTTVEGDSARGRILLAMASL